MAVATLFSTEMGQLTANAGGAIQTLPPVPLEGGRRRTVVGTVPLAAQASGSVIGLFRLPLYCVPLMFTLLTDTSLGTATIALGDANTTALFLAAQTFTTVNVPTNAGNAATLGVMLSTGYDSVTGNLVTPFMPQKVGQGGALYEDVLLTTAVAALPGAGTLKIFCEYAID